MHQKFLVLLHLDMKGQIKPRQFKNTKVDLERNVIVDIIHIIYTLRKYSSGILNPMYVDEGNLFCVLVTPHYSH